VCVWYPGQRQSGFIVLAAIHAGILSFDCEECQDAPWYRESQGCETPTQMPVWEDGAGNEYYNCPYKWVTDNILEWYQQLSYDTEMHTALPYNDQSNKYIDAWMVYKYHLNRFNKEQLDKSKKDSTSESLDSLQDGYKARQ